MCAAIAAARHGADVLLIEREFAPGGLATLGLITCYLPICDGCGQPTQVPFQPRGDRPVYCRACFEANRQNRF